MIPEDTEVSDDIDGRTYPLEVGKRPMAHTIEEGEGKEYLGIISVTILPVKIFRKNNIYYKIIYTNDNALCGRREPVLKRDA
jgi:hypothetical protein